MAKPKKMKRKEKLQCINAIKKADDWAKQAPPKHSQELRKSNQILFHIWQLSYGLIMIKLSFPFVWPNHGN